MLKNPIEQIIAGDTEITTSDDDFELTEHDLLLQLIPAAALNAAENLADNADYLTGVVFPRYQARFRWRGREVRLWRLDLVHPLWLGADGEIYRGYDIDRWDGPEYPHYLMLAEIERRGVVGLRRVLKAVLAFVPEGSGGSTEEELHHTATEI